MSAHLAVLASVVGAVLIPAGKSGAADSRGAGEVDPQATVVTDVVHDSRMATAGSLFACIEGDRFDGHDFAPAAVQAGAVALLTSRRLGLGVAEVVVPDVRAVLGAVAAEVHGQPSSSLTVIGVTGTNGKTTTVRMAARLAATLGLQAEEIGTLTGPRTTPEAPDLQRELAEASRRGAELVAMEVSSHALDQRRVDATRFAAVGFTNLGVDHLDHHGDMDAYYAAKARLFTPDFASRCVIDARSSTGRRLLDETALRSTAIDDGTFEVRSAGSRSTTFAWRGHHVQLALGGAFNVANAVLAAELLVCVGMDPARIAAAFGAVEQIPGRFQVIDSDSGVTVVVDYAHTPDGLEAVLEAARTIAEGSVSVVFGAGGDRDQQKRPLMGEVASRLADRVVLTSDNPRSESAAAIIDEIAAGMRRPPERAIVERGPAIRRAIAEASPGDIVVVAGKGHEKTQETGADVVEFDDVAVARQELLRRGRA